MLLTVKSTRVYEGLPTGARPKNAAKPVKAVHGTVMFCACADSVGGSIRIPGAQIDTTGSYTRERELEPSGVCWGSGCKKRRVGNGYLCFLILPGLAIGVRALRCRQARITASRGCRKPFGSFVMCFAWPLSSRPVQNLLCSQTCSRVEWFYVQGWCSTRSAGLPPQQPGMA